MTAWFGSTNECVLEEPFASLWASRDPFAEAEAIRGDIVRDIEGRRTLRFEVAGKGYYLKLHRGVGWGAIVGNLFRLRLPVLGADSEWHAIRAFDRLGLDTMRVVGFGQRGSGPAHLESFLITEALEPTCDLDVFTQSWPDEPPPVKLKHALILSVADIARRMHEGGINHRDFYLCHFLLHLAPPPTPDALHISVIDLHRAQIRDQTPQRWRDKDLAALYFSALRIGLTRRDRLRFIRAYFAGSLREILKREHTRLARLEQEGQRLLLRYDRKFAHRPALQR